ncbi:MAG: ABC transporter permease, partial [Cyclobacteriaceae bacterium]
DDLVASGMTEEDAFDKVTRDKIGDLQKLAGEYHKAKSTSSSPTPKFSRSLTTNFVRVAIRNIIKNRPHSFINLAGLAIGLASVIIISVYVYSELSFDRFHADNNRIFRLMNKIVRGDSELKYPQGPPALAPALASNFPEIEYATRMRYADRPLLQYDEKTFYEDHAFYADSSFFKIFDFDLIEGNRLTALNRPNAVIISESTAKKYFGNGDAINKTLLLEGDRPLLVTGIIKDVPHHSHLYFDVLISFQTYVVPEGYLENLDSWAWMGFVTYAKTVEGVDIKPLEQKIADKYKSSDKRLEQMNLTVVMQRLPDIYLGSSDLSNPNNIFRGNSYTTLYSLMSVGILIILIASFNYVNLSIAMAMSRFKEIAMRKVLGSTKGKLVLQFIMESVLYALIALVVAVVIVIAGQQIFPGEISSRLVLDGRSLMLYSLALVSFVCLIGIISGVFPALRLSSITSLDLLKGTFTLKGGNLRNVLIGFQFALSAGLVAISLIIGKQIEFFSNKSMGFVKDGIVSINISSDQVEGRTMPLQNQLRNNTDVTAITLTSHIMGEGLSGGPLRLREQQAEDAVQMAY